MNELIIEGAKQNNLKNISLKLPHNTFITVTGVSGSGKSSLAFDTLFAEGQWRFIESLSTYVRLFIEKLDRPEVDAIRNIRPAIALEQRNPVKTSRSTVGTTTEIYDYLRLLYAKAARPHCPRCGTLLRSWTPSSAAQELVKRYSGEKALIIFASTDTADELRRKGFHRIRPPQKKGAPAEVVLDRLVIRDEPRLADSLETAWEHGHRTVTVEILGPSPEDTRALHFHGDLKCHDCGVEIPQPQPLLFSFNHPLGACPECTGFGNTLEYAEYSIVPDRDLSLEEGAIEPWSKPAARWWYRQFAKKAKAHGISLNVPYKALPAEARKLLFTGADDFYGINDFFEELEGKRYKLHVRVFLSRYRKAIVCRTCRGIRLRPEAGAFRLGGIGIAEAARYSIGQLKDFFPRLELTEEERTVSAEILRQLGLKLDFLVRVGIDYLTLNREAKTLSGGEAQRINLSNQLASRLTGTLYVLDEPTVGLHARDVGRIAGILRELSSAGNTVIAVEHDRTIIDAADWVVELGPGGGENGGAVVFSGPREDFILGNSLTAAYLDNAGLIPVPKTRKKGSGKALTITGACGHNLKNITISVPLRTLTCVTGVSGSGKSTIVHDTVYHALARHFKVAFNSPEPYQDIRGLRWLRGVRIIDQDPIGKSPRSNPVTYIKAFDPIRKLFADQPQSSLMGFTPGHFSFNTEGGRCPVCTGAGYQRLEMYFFEDLYVTCEECNGKRYKPDVLTVTYNGKNIHEVLNLTIDEAVIFFGRIPALAGKLALMSSVGLGYLRLGQPATTLSGGEAQRLKICAELGVSRRKDFLYILDEPTVGLHPDDIKKLLVVLNTLVDAGNTVLLVEHNMDVIKSADWIIDIGPEGGEAGGRVIAEGTPEHVAGKDASITGRYLRPYLVDRAARHPSLAARR
ncbi:MAG: excinuclease ABC subunit UvrA [Nitrospiraceae bacterium]|nr:MAG: excinuclease ABC subunit UvrA [Nitrospiraceae bacterium]